MKDILYILTIAECRSISKAAEILYISQPALSRYISKLEQELGLELFVRSSGGISLTEAGRIYVKYGQEIERLKDEMDEELKTIYRDKVQNIHIAMTLRNAYKTSVEIQNLFKEKYPDSNLFFSHIMSSDIASGLEKHRYNMAVGPSIIMAGSDIGFEKICEEYLLFMVPERWDLKEFSLKKKGVKYPWLDLREIPQVDYVLQENNTGVRKYVNRIFEEYEMEVIPKFTTVNSMFAIQAVKNQMGCCFITEEFFPYITDKKKYQFYSVGRNIQKSDSCIFYLKDKHFTKQEHCCMAIISQVLQDNYMRITEQIEAS